MVRALTELTEYLKSRRMNSGFHFMNNEASTDLKMTMTTMNIKYRLVTPKNHRAKNSEISIKTLKTLHSGAM